VSYRERRTLTSDLHVAVKILRMNMFTASDKVKPNTGNIIGLNLAAGRITTKLLY
jgi:hypothetical protein